MPPGSDMASNRLLCALLGLVTSLALVVTGCTDPEPGLLPALSTEQLRTSVLVTTDMATREDKVTVFQGSEHSENLATRKLAFASHQAAVDALAQMARTSTEVRWDTLGCGGFLLLKGSEEIDGEWATVELSVEGSSDTLSVRVASPDVDGGPEPTDGPVEIVGDDCDPAVVAAVGA